MPQPSKFAGVFAQLSKDETPAAAPAKRARKLNPKLQAKLMASPDAPGDSLPPLPAPSPEPVPAATTEATPRRRGRPPGMKSDERFRMTSIMLNKELGNALQYRLMMDSKHLSDVVNELLLNWLISREKADPSKYNSTIYAEELETIREQFHRK